MKAILRNFFRTLSSSRTTPGGRTSRWAAAGEADISAQDGLLVCAALRRALYAVSRAISASASPRVSAEKQNTPSR